MNRCGACDLCCRLPPIDELGKAQGVPCPHHTGTSCAVWATRPVACRNFRCLWYANPSFPDALRPDRCGAYFEPLRGRPVVLVMVDTMRPDAWQKGIVKGLIDRFVANRTSVAIVVGSRNHFRLPPDTAFVPVWRHILDAAESAGVRR